MKKSELAFTAVLVPLDYLLVFAAALTAYSLRFGWLADLRPVVFEMPIADFMLFSAVASGVFILMYALSGLYGISGPRRIRIELANVFLASSTAIMAVVLIVFLRHELFESRFIVLAAWALSIIYVSIGRILTRLLQRLLLRFGIGTRRVVLIGRNGSGDVLTKDFSTHPALGFRVMKRFKELDERTLDELTNLVSQDWVDELIITDAGLDRDEVSRVLGFAQSHHIGFRYTADLLATHAKNIEINTISGIPIVEIKGTRLDGWGRIFKRIFDVIVSLLLIIILSPVFVITAIAVKIDSRGPVFFSRLKDRTPVTRIGEHNRPFRYFKFRSMKPGTHEMRYQELAHLDTRDGGPLVKIKDDPRVTRVGRFIRRWSIDELPELFLVLIGSMSLVGPRPHLPEEVAKYRDDQRRVLTVKPGITGMAQVSGRSDLTFDDEVRLDLFYIENWSPWLDLSILVRTPHAVIRSRKTD